MPTTLERIVGVLASLLGAVACGFAAAACWWHVGRMQDGFTYLLAVIATVLFGFFARMLYRTLFLRPTRPTRTGLRLTGWVPVVGGAAGLIVGWVLGSSHDGSRLLASSAGCLGLGLASLSALWKQGR